MENRVPYSVRKERLRQAKLAEEAKPSAPKDKAYVVEVKIPIRQIVLQSKTPTEEPEEMSLGKPPKPAPAVDNGPLEAEMVNSVEAAIVESVQPIEPEPVIDEIEDHGSVVVSSVVVEEAPPDEEEPVAIEEEPLAEEEPLPEEPAVVSAVEIPAAEEEPVAVSAVEIPAAEEEEVVVVSAVEIPEAEEEEKPVEVIEPSTEEEVLAAAPVVEEESAPLVVEEEPVPVVAEVPVVPAVPAEPATFRESEDAEPEITLQDVPTILDLIYWRDIKKTGVVFGSMLFILLSLAIFSVLSVVAYLSLAILAVTLSFRVYKNIMQAVQKSGDGHPFKEYLEWDIELNDQKTSKVVKLVMKHFNATARELRRLFLVEDLVDTIKFGLLLWVLTYIGSWFNGMTLIINSVVIVFTLPKVYETYKVQIDNYLAMARSQFNKILHQVQSKLPFLKKKAKAQ